MHSNHFDQSKIVMYLFYINFNEIFSSIYKTHQVSFDIVIVQFCTVLGFIVNEKKKHYVL